MSNEAVSRPGSAPGRSHRGRRYAAVAIVAGALVVGATACSSSSTPSTSSSSSTSGTSSAARVDVSNVTLNIGDQAGAGAQALLTAAGLIDKLPFKAHFADFTSGPPMLQAESSGSVDIGFVGNAPPVFAAAAGGQIAAVGANVTDLASGATLVPKNSPIKTVADLKGKTIAVAQGSSANYHILALLEKNGLTVKDVKLDYLQPAQAQAAFASGHVDAWDVWTPFIEQAEVQDGATALADWTPIGKTYSFEIASRSALNNPQKAAAIKDFLQIYNQAYEWANSNQSAWAGTWGKATGLSSAIMTKAVADDVTTWVGITPDVISSEQSVADAFYAAGLIPTKVDFSKFAVTTYNSVWGAS